MDYSKNVKGMWDAHKERLNWETKEIWIKAVARPESRIEYPLNIVTTMMLINRPPKFEVGECHWIPGDKFRINTVANRRDYVIPYFVNACIKAGFNITSKGFEKSDSLPTRAPDGTENQVSGVLRLICNRGIHHHTKARGTGTGPQPATDNNNLENDPEYLCGDRRPTIAINEKKPVPRSYRPTKGKEDKCTFKFCVYYSREHSRWYLPYDQAGNNMHCDHIRREPEE